MSECIPQANEAERLEALRKGNAARKPLLPASLRLGLTGCLLSIFSICSAQSVGIIEYPLPSSNTNPNGIVSGPDGALWFTEAGGNKIGQITTAGGVLTEYAIPTPASQPKFITAGPDGALWFTESAGNKIGRITTAGIITDYTVPTSNSSPSGIAAGPDGALWFTESAGNKIGRITTAGVIAEYVVPTSGGSPEAITAGSDGALWFAESSGNKIGRITTAGAIIEYPVPTPGSSPLGPTAGPDGALWFAELNGDRIGRITTAGAITEYAIPTPLSGPQSPKPGPDGALWFVEHNSNKVGRISTAGAINEYPVPTPNSGPLDIAAGQDGALWFTESAGNNIGRAVVRQVNCTAIFPAAVPNGNPGQDSGSSPLNYISSVGPQTTSWAFTVSPSNCSWTIANNTPGWLSISSPVSGAGNGSVSYSLTANNTSAVRTASLTVSSGSAVATHQNFQNPQQCGFQVSQPSPQGPVPSGGGGYLVTVTSNGCWWKLSDADSWITGLSTTAAATQGTAIKSFHVSSNTGSLRQSPISLYGDLSPSFLTVTQVGAGASPTLTSISPNSGAPGTTVNVTLTGANFSSDAVVNVNYPGIAVSNVKVVSATQITATFSIGANTSGSANVSVTTSGGNSGAVSFGIGLPTLTLTSISPNSGTPGASVNVTLTGANFSSGATVNVSNPGITVNNVNVVSATQITATFVIAANSSGSANVNLTTLGSTSNVVSFTINPLMPTLSSISPNAGAPGASVNVTLMGANFISGATVNVSNAGVTVSNVNVVSASQITATFAIAANASGSANASVTTAGGTSGTVSFSINAATPTVTSISPNSGAPGASVNVTLTGANFASGATVNVSNAGVTVSNVTVVSASQITATFAIAANASGSANVSVTTAGGTSGTVSFSINAATPTVTSISPNSGAPGASVNVTLTGTNFASGATVNVSNAGVTVSNVNVVSASQITATFAIAANASGSANASVTTAGGTSGTVSFSINPLTPTLSSTSPNAGAPGASVNVTLTGTNFASGATVNVSNAGVTVSNVNVVSATQITATFAIAANASGSANVSVTTAGGTSGTVSFSINPLTPTLSSISPNSGAPGANVNVTFTGANFVSGATVNVNNAVVTVSNVNVVNATQITATFAIAANASGSTNATVTTAGGTSSAVIFTINPLTPVLTSISPNTGTAGGSVNVALTGASFSSGATVNVNNNAVTVSNVNVVSATQITATFAIGANALGSANVTVTTAGGTSSAVSFTITPQAPALTSISPSTGPPGASVNVTLTGSNFVAGPTVNASNAGVTVSNVNVVSATQITATLVIASNASGSANVTVTTAGGTSGGVSFSINPVTPTLTSISPSTGPPGASVNVTLTGANFISGAVVKVNNPGVSASNVNVVSSTQITATLAIAANASGSSNVTVTTASGTSSAVIFTVNPLTPVLNSISPNTGTAGTSVNVTLTGANFISGATVNVSNAAVTVGNVNVASATQITATFVVGANASGVANVTVTTTGGTTGVGSFTINPLTPALTSISPNNGAPGASVNVTLTGANFVANPTVNVSNPAVTVSSVTLLSTNQITATFAIAANASGSVNVTVTTAGGTSGSVNFTINPPAPTLNSISPNSGLAGTSATVTLTGSNFLSGATVNVSNAGIAVSNVNVLSTNQITATFAIAANASGSANVTVTTLGGTSGAVSFTINPLTTTLTSISPNTGAPGASVNVTLTGANFVPGATVNVSAAGVTVSNVTVVSSTQITATFAIAANASGSATVTVTTLGGTTSPVSFTITVLTPTLTSISPNAAPPGGSVNVTLTGSNFVSGSTINVSNAGVTVNNVSVVSSTQITATFAVPANASGSPNVTVTTLGGTTSAVSFSINSAAPTLTSITPNAAAPGASVNVTLAGTNFVSGATLNVSNAGVSVSNVNVVSATQITATFALAANASGSANVTVTTAGGTSGTVSFSISSGTPALTSISPNAGAPGASANVTLTGSNFVSGATLNVSNVGVTVSNVSVVSATQITATFAIAANASGSANVTVTTAGGTSGAVSFSINSATPALTSISPNAGAPGASVNVTLTGSNFVSGATVNVTNAGVAVSNVSVVSSTQITAKFAIAANASGSANVTVTTAGGTSGTVSFGINSGTPVLTSVSPSGGLAGASGIVTLTGSNFLPGATVNVSNSGVAVSNVTVVSSTTITFQMDIDPSASGPANLTVTTSAGTSGAVIFTVSSITPTLTAISPSSSGAGNSVNVTLTGSNFYPGATVVNVDNPAVTVSNLNVLSDTQITATFDIQPGASGSVDVTVTVTLFFLSSNSVSFSINSLTPAIASISPNNGVPGANVSVTLTGSNFTSDSTVSVSNPAVTVNNVNVLSDTQITATFAIAANASGSASVVVANAVGTSNTVNFSVNPTTPTLTSIAPNAGAPGSSVNVTLTGSNFVSGATVNVSNAGVSVSNLNVVSASQITATFAIAADASGSANVTVTTAGGTSGPVTFTINALAPTLTSISPNNGLAGTSGTVTLTGTNFVSGATVNVNNTGLSVGNVSVVSATQITATFAIAANASGSANVTVTTSSGTSSAVTFTIGSSISPTLTSVSPSSGVAGTSVNVTLTGSNFGSDAVVNVNNPAVTVSNAIVVSSTQITATLAIAANASGSAKVTVTAMSLLLSSNTVSFTINGSSPSTTGTPLGTTLAGGTVGVAYSTTPPSATGGTPYQNWTVTCGNLPPGLSLDPGSAVVSGTPTTGTGSPFTFCVQASDTSGTKTAPQTFSIAVAVPPVIVMPTALSFSFRQGDQAPPLPLSISVLGTSLAATCNVTATSDTSWLAVNVTSGQTPFAATASVNANVKNLAPGPYGGQVSVTCSGANPVVDNVAIKLRVDPPNPVLSVTPPSLSLAAVQNGPPIPGLITVSNTGGGTILFTATTQGASCLNLGSTSGSAAFGQPAILSYTVNSALSPGVCSEQVNLQGQTPDLTATVSITVVVNPQPHSIRLSQTGLQFTAAANGGPISQSFAVLNPGLGTLNWKIQTTTLSGGSSWLTVTPTAGSSNAQDPAPPLVTVTVDPSQVSTGQYFGSISVMSDPPSDAPNSPQTVSVLLNVVNNGTMPTAYPSGLIFAGPAPQSQQIAIFNSTGKQIGFTSTYVTDDGQNWCLPSPAAGTIAQGQTSAITLQANVSALTPSLRQCTLTLAFSDGSAQTVQISSIPTSGASTTSNEARPAAVCGATKLILEFISPVLRSNFNVASGDAVSVQVQAKDDCGVPVTTGGMAVAFTGETQRIAPMSHQGGGVWATTWVASGGTARSVTATATAFSTTSAGILQGQAMLTGTVTSKAEPTAASSAAAVNSASYQGVDQVAPGTFISIFGSQLATAPARGTLPLSTQLSDTQVLLGPSALPLQYASDAQINAVVPLTLPANTIQQLVIRHGATQSFPIDVTIPEQQPGIYTLSQNGVGQAVIVNGVTNVMADAKAPVTAHNFITIYCTGLGQVSNAPSDGQPAPMPPPLSTSLALPVVTIGGIQSPNVSYSGLAPGFVGLYQVNAEVPAGIQPGLAVPVTLTIGGATSNITTIAVN